MYDSGKEIKAERRRLKAQYRQLFDDVAELLFRHDPMTSIFKLILTNTNLKSEQSCHDCIRAHLRMGLSESCMKNFAHGLGLEKQGRPKATHLLPMRFGENGKKAIPRFNNEPSIRL
jgi:hypothetical protein